MPIASPAGDEMRDIPGDSCGRFHLKDGRRLVFYPIRRWRIGRRTGEVLAAAFVLTAAVLAATLLAASHAPRHPSRAAIRTLVR